MEFDWDGNWTSISCRRGRRVPAGLVPSSILRHVRNRYRSVYIVDIDREKNKYEVELSNGMELTFNKHGKLIDVDDWCAWAEADAEMVWPVLCNRRPLPSTFRMDTILPNLSTL